MKLQISQISSLNSSLSLILSSLSVLLSFLPPLLSSFSTQPYIKYYLLSFKREKKNLKQYHNCTCSFSKIFDLSHPVCPAHPPNPKYAKMIFYPLNFAVAYYNEVIELEIEGKTGKNFLESAMNFHFTQSEFLLPATSLFFLLSLAHIHQFSFGHLNFSSLKMAQYFHFA